MTYSFKLIKEVLDDGQHVIKVVIDYATLFYNSVLSPKQFKVQATTYKQDGTIYYQGPIKVKKAYVSTSKGEWLDCGGFVTLELDVIPLSKATASIYYDMVFEEDGNWNFLASYNKELKLEYTVENILPLASPYGIVAATKDYTQEGEVDLEADAFASLTSKSGLQYRLYTPSVEGKHPLIIWFHGSGEGGQDNASQILGNRGGTAFVSRKAQAIFGGTYVLAPQSPDNWTLFQITSDSNINIPLPKNLKPGKDYKDDVLSMIDEVLENNPNIDEKRIYILGCSAGGSMTWHMATSAPERFACAVPICGGDQPKEKLANLKECPIWMVHCATDETVPYSASVNNHALLNELGYETYLTTYPIVKEGKQVYNAHWSWVKALNNEPINDEGISLFEWMASKAK